MPAPATAPPTAGSSAPLPLPERPPGMMLRVAVLAYEAVLLFGVVFAAGYALLAISGWTYPLSPPRRWILQAVLFVAIGAYFVTCWARTGQTLAMKSWRLRVVDRDGGRLSPARALARYLLAWSLFAPGLLFVALAGARALTDLLALLASLILMLAAARLDPGGQLLHDRVLGSRVIRE